MLKERSVQHPILVMLDLDVRVTAGVVTIDAGRFAGQPIEATEFTLEPGQASDVAYNLFVVQDRETELYEYYLDKIYLSTELPGYEGNHKLIHKFIDIVVKPDATWEGEVIYINVPDASHYVGSDDDGTADAANTY